jgi:hypothetical protein
LPGAIFVRFAAFVAAQSALLYGYVLWGGIKETRHAWALPLLVAVAVPTVERGSPRQMIRSPR